jgi:hypothetical protein
MGAFLEGRGKMITFDEALGQITILYEEAKRLHGNDLNEAFEKNRKEFWGDVRQWDLDAFIESSDLNAQTFDITKKAVAKILEQKQTLSDFSTEWLIKFLRDEIERPPESAGRKGTLGRDSFIVYAIQLLKDQGMPANPRMPAAGNSACEVLAQVITPVVSQRTITNIWNERPKTYIFGKIHWESDLNHLSRQFTGQ